MVNELDFNSKVPIRSRSLNWAQHIDYMIRLDKKTKEIAELFRWAQEDEFLVNASPES